MTDAESANCILLLSAAFGPPEETQEALWMNILSVIDVDRGMAAIEHWIMNENFWPRPAEINGLVRELGEHARFQPERSLPARTCDGTGWRTIDEGLMPCDVCNPALHRVFSDHDLLRRWRAGEPTKRLVDTESFIQPEAYCMPDLTHEDPNDRMVSPEVGRRLAWNAHVQDAEAGNCDLMDEDAFMRMLGRRLQTPV